MGKKILIILDKDNFEWLSKISGSVQISKSAIVRLALKSAKTSTDFFEWLKSASNN